MQSLHAQAEGQETIPWREIAWSGIRFSVPERWQIWEIGSRYLLFGDTAGPAFEVKWERIRGPFVHRTVLRRMAAMQPRKGRLQLQAVTLPVSWACALTGFNARGFSWTCGTGGGAGVLLYHPRWQTAVMGQFFKRSDGWGRGIRPQVLASFRSNRRDGGTYWSVFNLQAEIPDGFVLKQHRFDAGAFELVFAGRGSRLVLNRWGPAGVLLENQGLAEFGAALDGFALGRQVPGPAGDGQRADWVWGADTGVARRFWRWMTGARACARCRLWVPAGHNQIMGVRIAGRSPVSAALMEKICSGYGLVA